MRAKDNTKEQPINEVVKLRQRTAELETSETERKRAEEEIERAAEEWEATFDAIADLVWIEDRDFKIVRVNKAFADTFKMEPKELIGKICYEIVHGTKEPPPNCLFRQTLQTKKPTTAASFEPHLGIYLELSTSPIFDEQGEVVGIVHLAKDITERKQVEEALQESEERYRLLVENVNEAVVVVQDWMLKFFNLKAMELTGYSGEELASKPFAEFIHPDDRQMVMKRHLERLKGEEAPYTYQFRLIGKNGDVIWGEADAVLITWEGRPATLSLLNDISERKRAEEALKNYSERLEEMVEERTRELRDAQEELVRKEKLAILGQLAGGVGHDLRNPLGAIKNVAYFLNMVLEEPEPELKEALQILDNEVATSERIISSLLDFARPKSPIPQEVDINDVIQNTLSRIAVPENVQVMSQRDEALPPIRGDPDQLGQVFANIILNAIQAMTEGGQLAVKSEVPGPGWVAISFADTGVGIPEENLVKIFEPLFTSKAKGIGLGLAVIKTLVEGHDGTIEVQSEMGKGSTFTVRLPIGGEDEK